MISTIDEMYAREKRGMKELREGPHEEVISKPDVLRVLSFFSSPPPPPRNLFLLFLDSSSTRVVVSPARLSRMLTVIRSRIISVIIAQPDVGAWPTFPQCIINDLFPPLLRMILFLVISAAPAYTDGIRCIRPAAA